jgi:hypothetical protein
MKFLNLFLRGSVARDGLGGGEKRRPVSQHPPVFIIIKTKDNGDRFPIGCEVVFEGTKIPQGWEIKKDGESSEELFKRIATHMNEN